MWRHLVLTGVVYPCLTGIVYLGGHPVFDGSRPVVLDRPLQGFYYTVNETAMHGGQVLTAANETRARYWQAFLAEARKQIDEFRSGS
jgi:hypothetical protein